MFACSLCSLFYGGIGTEKRRGSRLELQSRRSRPLDSKLDSCPIEGASAKRKTGVFMFVCRLSAISKIPLFYRCPFLGHSTEESECPWFYPHWFRNLQIWLVVVLAKLVLRYPMLAMPQLSSRAV
jgi:hypothetical protein